jgi:demethylspheroidene O-methyltransferase
MAGTKGAEPVGAAYFGFYLLAMGSGRARTAAEIEAMLTAAGFLKVQHIQTSQPMLTSLITAGV